jgi:hypothetical protein
LRVHVCEHLLERRAEARALVVGRNDDAVSGLQKQLSILSRVCQLDSHNSEVKLLYV